MKPNSTIGIIGDSGAMGKWLRTFFEHQGLFVIGSSLDSKLSNRQVVEKSDVIIFAVSLEAMVSVIQELVLFSREDQLWMDVGSRKEEIVYEMLKSKAEVVGLHPLCAPPRQPTLEGQKLICCPARLDQWSQWVKHILKKTCATVLQSEPAYHDQMMRRTQNIPHAALIATAVALMNLECSRDEFLTYSTASSRKVLDLIDLMLRNSPGVYADIQVGSGKKGRLVLDKIIDALCLIRKSIQENNRQALLDLLQELKVHFSVK